MSAPQRIPWDDLVDDEDDDDEVSRYVDSLERMERAWAHRPLTEAQAATLRIVRERAGRERPAPSHFVDVAVHACRLAGSVTRASLMQSARALDGEPS